MKKLVGLVLLACGLFVYPCLSFAENIYADIVITPSAYTGFFGGLAGGDGNPGPNSIDWSLGNSVPFGSMTDDMVFSTATGDFMTGSNWKERMRITKDGKIGIGTSNPGVELEIAASNKDATLNLTTYDDVFDNYSFINLKKSNSNVLGTKSETNPEDLLGAIFFYGVNSSGGFQYGAGIVAVQEGPSGSLRIPTTLHLYSFSDSSSNQPQLVLVSSGNVGIGTESPSVKLEVNGKVRADEFLTGDIVFHKGDKPVWRMYEDEKGLYVQSLTTDKNYALVLDEMVDGVCR